jgi:molybdopterin synthase catalytic subunit
MKVVQLEYEAYAVMAMKQMMQICQDVREKWPVCKIAIVHRTGYAILCKINFCYFQVMQRDQRASLWDIGRGGGGGVG